MTESEMQQASGKFRRRRGDAIGDAVREDERNACAKVGGMIRIACTAPLRRI